MGKFLKTYFFAIAMIVVVVVIFDAAEKIDDFLESHASMSEILTGYYLNFIPYFINQFSGLFTFIAVIFFTSKMAYDTEIIAILSSGVSFRRLMYPYFLSAMLITSFSLFLNLLVIPAANENRIAFDREFMAKNSASDIYERYTYRQVAPSTFAFIRDYNNTEQRAGFFVLESYEGGRVTSSLQAQDAYYNAEKGSWSANRYTIRRGDSLQKFTTPFDTVINLIPDELGKVEELVQTMTSARLANFITAQKQKGSDMVAIFQIESASRYAYPIATFVLTLIGVSLSSRKVRGGMGYHIGVGIALCFSYIVLMRFAAEFAKSGTMPPLIAVWMPNILYLFISIYLYKRAPK